MNKRKGVVYFIPCTVCPKVYIGQTGRFLKHQLKEHRRALRNGDVATSALAEHALMAGHGIDLSKAEVLYSNVYSATQYMLTLHRHPSHPSHLCRHAHRHVTHIHLSPLSS